MEYLNSFFPGGLPQVAPDPGWIRFAPKKDDSESHPVTHKPSDPSLLSNGGEALVLVVEDNRADVFLVERAVEIHKLKVRLLVLDDGEEALEYFERANADSSIPCPDVVLLDLNLPRRSGREVLERVRQARRCKDVPVIILTSSNSPEDRREAKALGAMRYFRKPTSYQDFLKIGEVLNEVLNEVKP